ncbi:DUF7937 domain-containing protein [Rhodococcoides yunnanense]|uniref:DUF7937 domain-containing protein n=1 Tax=Rhodococcoides yunnanense TaxID=278209 RepID=UPI0009349D63|nr:hypothetical protein [Rhodococcus yunnanensis]
MPAPPPPGQAKPYEPKPSPFTDIPVSDYVRDGVAAILLFVSFFLPWTTAFGIARGGSGGIIALVVLVTILSLASLGLPYLARLGMLGQNWQVGQVRVLRLVANGPFLVTVIAFLGYDVIRGLFRFSETSSVFSGDGIGSAAWIGLAGALLAAQPRAAELRIDPRSAPRWLGWIKPLMFVATGFAVLSGLLGLIFVLVTLNRYGYTDGAATLQSLVVVLVSSAVPVAVLGTVSAGLARRFGSWRLTVAGFGVALLVAGFFLSFDDLASVELFLTVTVYPYYSVTFWVAAAAIAFLPFGVPAAADASHGGYVWLEAARNGLRIIAVWSFGTALTQIALAATDFGIVSVGESIALAAFSVLIGVLAVVGTKALGLRYSSEDPRPSREVTIGICLGLLVLMIARMVTQSIMYDYGYPSVWTFDLAAAAATIFIALSVAVAPAIRDLYSGVPLFASVTAGPSPAAGYGPGAAGYGPGAAASDPRTPAATLFEIATTTPELRPAVAANPSTYDELLDWLGKLNDPAVDAALARRAAGQFGLPAETVTAPVASAPIAPVVPQPVVQTPAVPTPAAPTPAAQPWSDPAVQASDPQTPAARLFEIASTTPELRPAVAANPSTYRDLVDWLGKLNDPAVDAALARRAAGQFGLPDEAPNTVNATKDPVATEPASQLSSVAVSEPASAEVPPAETTTAEPRVEPTREPAVEIQSEPAAEAAAPARAATSDTQTETIEVVDPDAQAVADPSCSAAVLFRLAEHRPDLRVMVATHPNAYPGLLEWLGTLGDPAVDQALKDRR